MFDLRQDLEMEEGKEAVWDGLIGDWFSKGRDGLWRLGMNEE